MAKDEKIFTFRVSSEILDYLKRRADRNKRSIAKELEYIVESLYFEENQEIDLKLKKLLEFVSAKDYKSGDLNKILNNSEDTSPIREEIISLLKLLNAKDI